MWGVTFCWMFAARACRFTTCHTAARPMRAPRGVMKRVDAGDGHSARAASHARIFSIAPRPSGTTRVLLPLPRTRSWPSSSDTSRRGSPASSETRRPQE